MLGKYPSSDHKNEKIDQENKLTQFLSFDKYLNRISPDFKVERWQDKNKIIEKIKQNVSDLVFSKVVECDVCLENFIADTSDRLSKAGRIFAESMELSSSDIDIQTLNDLYPEYDSIEDFDKGKVRVHGITKDNKYQTYCHFCDDDMCLSELNIGRDWDRVYQNQYQSFLKQIPDKIGLRCIFSKTWADLEKNPDNFSIIQPAAKKYFFSGSTSWSVNLDLIVTGGILNIEHVDFAHDGKKWSVSLLSADDNFVKKISTVNFKNIDNIK